MVVTDKDGNKIDEWVSTKDPHYIYYLEPGTYYLEETLAPEGYQLETQKVEFTVENDGKVVSVDMTNAQVVKEVPKTGTTQNKALIGFGVGLMSVGSAFIVKRRKLSLLFHLTK